ncbi:hypothetical protein J5N97_020036 [Dioscorea zingiberensis]|uniref:Hpc2-related domain-containing protein n=1 Tax=Dioscorea zingiberensis TaxID=325984 RepID=A0A9D5HD98_9LILI|nr:hypothetical protein J5N97_020036 [Dioscorea zingiberensis]
MEDEKASAAGPVRAATVVEGAPVASSSEVQKELPGDGQRLRFTVELKPGETTIVSWKRLLKESGKSGGAAAVSSGVDPAFGVQVQAAEHELKDAPPSNRVSAVIEKIERLYMGKHSSDEEELDDVPDDDEYDTEDSFIDDAELDEYFQVEKSTTKHNGYFVNKGKLERIETSSSPNLEPKKRKRKDPARGHGEKDGKYIPKEPVNMGNMRIKAAARNISSAGKKSLPTTVLTPFPEHNQEVKHLKNKLNVPNVAYKKRPSDPNVNSENPAYMKTPYNVASAAPLESKDDKQKAGLTPSRDSIYKARGPGESFDAMYPAPWDKAVPSQVESHPKKLSNGETDIEASIRIKRKERNGYSEFSDFSSSASMYHGQVVQSSSVRMKEDAAVRPKGTTLERAIRDLEKIVAACRPPDLNIQEIDPSTQGIKRRLPQEVKQKLAKVARLSVNQCKASKDNLIDRLMGILGHLVQRRTLKRNMKEMIQLGLSAKQEKADRFQQIKKEVNEMIRTRVSLWKSKVAEQQDGSADDFQEVPINDEKRVLKGAFSMDKALEDKICDLYDLYVEGMDEDKGPQSRKLYVELAELWPNGYMDNFGIKEAIYRSKQRKKAMYSRYKARDEERIKRKRLTSSMRADETLSAHVRSGQERPAAESSSQLNILPEKQLTNHSNSPLARPTEPTQPMNSFGPHLGSEHYEKARGGSTSMVVTEDGIYNVKKKVKRRSESDQGEIQAFPIKPPHQDGKERHKPQKQGDDANVSNLHKPNLALPAPSVGNYQN